MGELQTKPNDKQREVARALARGVSPQERVALAAYVEALCGIRDRKAHPMVKAKEAWAATLNSEVVWPVVRTILEEIKRHAWDERGTKGRAGIATSVAAMAVFGSQGAGIAALGGAIGVPLWLVFGAGGAFLAGLYEDLHKKDGSLGDAQPVRTDAGPKRRAQGDVIDVEARHAGTPQAGGPPQALLAPSARESRRTITSGDVIACLQCSRERIVTQEWLDKVAASRQADSVSRYGLQAADVLKLKCSACNSRALEVRRA